MYTGQVKLIYIDPPYNTDGDSFLYNDSFNHSTWLTFMRNRLSAAKQLLSKNGVIFVHCDYIEFGYIKVLMDEIFGVDRALPHITVKTSTPAGFKVVNPGLVNVAEHILIYCMGDKKSAIKNSYVKAGYQSDYKYVINNPSEPVSEWTYKNIQNLVAEENPNIQKESLQPLIEQFALNNSHRVFATYGPHKPSERMKVGIQLSVESPSKIIAIERDDDGYHYLLNGRLVAFYESKLKVVDGVRCPTQRLTDFWSDLSWDSIANEGGVTLKNGKKPERLLKRIIEIASEPNDLVLDFHLGSGTTCAVSHKMGRRYIGIEQLDYGDNDSVVRLKNVINGDTTGISKNVKWKGGGSFVYCEIAKTNQTFIDQIQEAKSSEELLGIWQAMQERAFLSYQLDVKTFNENASDFNQLDFADQQRFLMDVLDKNMLYVPLSEMDDAIYAVSESDKALNKQFFKM
ncbi:site-specific DNA-methyltransferase [Methylotenera sp.]|uniref:site-specific DNA-methyltransferase n=1 Tax=Methylotenera sp. TaxID=2051956 RepID=UPI0035210320